MGDSVRLFDLQNRLRELLPEYRFYHTLGVSYTAASLAIRHSLQDFCMTVQNISKALK